MLEAIEFLAYSIIVLVEIMLVAWLFCLLASLFCSIYDEIRERVRKS